MPKALLPCFVPDETDGAAAEPERPVSLPRMTSALDPTLLRAARGRPAEGTGRCRRCRRPACATDRTNAAREHCDGCRPRGLPSASRLLHGSYIHTICLPTDYCWDTTANVIGRVWEREEPS